MILSLSRVVPRRLHTSRTTSACPMRPHARATRFHRRNDWSSDADARKIALKNLENKRWRKRFLWKSGWSLKPCVISSYFQTCLDGFNRPRCFRVEPSTRKVKIDFLPTCFWVGRIYIYMYIYIHIYIYIYTYIHIYTYIYILNQQSTFQGSWTCCRSDCRFFSPHPNIWNSWQVNLSRCFCVCFRNPDISMPLEGWIRPGKLTTVTVAKLTGCLGGQMIAAAVGQRSRSVIHIVRSKQSLIVLRIPSPQY